MKTGNHVGLHTYQDLMLEGRTAVAGTRDCISRWHLLEPFLPRRGTVLDVGSNMGWFGWKITRTFPDCVVASVEPDEPSATLQRQMLQSHHSNRISLVTARAGANMAHAFVKAGQRFDAVLCLSVLHWLPQHRPFLASLGTIARRILVEQPDPRESGAGFARVRAEIGPIGAYLGSLFPDRPVQRLAQLASHRQSPYLRQIWLVDTPPDDNDQPSPGLEVEALLSLSLSWPPRNWWLQEYDRQLAGTLACQKAASSLLLTSLGLGVRPASRSSFPPGHWRRRLARLPQHRLLTPSDWCLRRVRRLGGTLLRGLRVLPSP